MNEIVVIKYYVNDFFKFNTIFIWIIYKNMLGIFGSFTLHKMNNYNLHSPLHEKMKFLIVVM
jgi:hypothetical protein